MNFDADRNSQPHGHGLPALAARLEAQQPQHAIEDGFVDSGAEAAKPHGPRDAAAGLYHEAHMRIAAHYVLGVANQLLNGGLDSILAEAAG